MEMNDGMPTAEFRKLYDDVFPVLFRIAYRIARTEDAAEDLCQEAFFKLYEKKMAFPSPDEAKYWLIRVVKNASLNYAKRKDREREVYQKAFREDQRVEESGEEHLIKKETKEEVAAALTKIPENLRAVLILKEYGEMNYKEIGDTLGISEGNVKVRVFRARERLSAVLAKPDKRSKEGEKNVS
ncbi:RNA polymerase subunit sigma-24 [Spirochaetia bacterium]|nr:RNA polymerase subunit sigma-24 [Spirochaetia bacterium]